MASSATLRIGSQLSAAPDAVADALARTIEALAGRPCRLTRTEPEEESAVAAPGTCYLLPVLEGDPAETVGVIALDEPAAIEAASALAMLDDDERATARETGVAPQKVRDALPELGRLLTGALAKLASGAEPPKLRADAMERQSPASWNAVPACAGDGVCHVLFALAVEDTPAGNILVALRGGGALRCRDEEALPGNLEGVTVRLLARPGDPAQVALGELVTSLEGRVSSPHRTHLPATPPAAAFIVSRSPSDLRARMESLIAEGERPPLIVACSDRPTRDLVLSARHSGADDFLVLPTTRKRLLSVLSGALQPA